MPALMSRVVRAAARWRERQQKEETLADLALVTFSGTKSSAVDRLAASSRKLQRTDHGVVDWYSTAGITLCSQFLDMTMAVTRRLKAPFAPRDFRANYPAWIRRDYPRVFGVIEARMYYVGILQVCLHPEEQHHGSLNVGAETVRSCRQLRIRWAELHALLLAWGPPGLEHSTLAIAEMRDALGEWDHAWADVERSVITEWMVIQENAKGMFTQAVEYDRALCRLEERGRQASNPEEHARALRQLSKSIARLNSAVATDGSGRDDLHADVLERAMAVVQRCQAEQAQEKGRSGKEAKALAAAGLLARRVVDAFSDLRKCIRETDLNIFNGEGDRLSLIPGFAKRLQSWEESWEFGRKYLMKPGAFDGFCLVAAEVKVAQGFAPSLEEACTSCDAELFVILPRIVWLCFLSRPAVFAEFMHARLPERVALRPPQPGKEEEVRPKLHRELEDLSAVFAGVRRQLLRALRRNEDDEDEEAEEAVWQLLVRQAVVGPSDAAGGPLAALPEGPQRVAKSFALRLESWSVELQRHCPKDWNSCCSVLLKCISEM